MKKRAKKDAGITKWIGIALTDGEKPLLPGTPEYEDAIKAVIPHLPAEAAAIIQRYKEPMPKGPRGEKRPADVIGNAVLIGRIATGEAEDTVRDPGKEANRKGGLKGGAARAKALSPDQRKKIAQKAAKARWGAEE